MMFKITYGPYGGETKGKIPLDPKQAAWLKTSMADFFLYSRKTPLRKEHKKGFMVWL